MIFMRHDLLVSFISALLVNVGAKLCFSENFILSCQAQNETFEDIYFLKLSKNASTTLSDIVFIKPDIPVSKPTDYTEEWKSANVRSRSSTDKSSVFPVNATRLVLTITKENIKETDEGVYVCWIKGRTVRGPVDEKYFIYKRVSVDTCPTKSGSDGWTNFQTSQIIFITFSVVVFTY